MLRLKHLRDINEVQSYMEYIYPGTIRAVLFDMDNTLFDFIASKLAACREILSYIAIEEENITKDPSEIFRYFLRGVYGFEDFENIRDYMQDRMLYTDQRYRQCCEIYENEKLQNLELYPGVRNTLEKLKNMGLKLAIITDADRHHAIARLTRVELLDSFDTLVASDMTGTKKPDPAHFLIALQALGASPEESLVVGDNLQRDMMPACKLGLKTAYASYGDWRPADEIDKCYDYKLDKFSDLLEYIRALNRH